MFDGALSRCMLSITPRVPCSQRLIMYTCRACSASALQAELEAKDRQLSESSAEAERLRRSSERAQAAARANAAVMTAARSSVLATTDAISAADGAGLLALRYPEAMPTRSHMLQSTSNELPIQHGHQDACRRMCRHYEGTGQKPLPFVTSHSDLLCYVRRHAPPEE